MSATTIAPRSAKAPAFVVLEAKLRFASGKAGALLIHECHE
jgi:hypothetical protein